MVCFLANYVKSLNRKNKSSTLKNLKISGKTKLANVYRAVQHVGICFMQQKRIKVIVCSFYISISLYLQNSCCFFYTWVIEMTSKSASWVNEIRFSTGLRDRLTNQWVRLTRVTVVRVSESDRLVRRSRRNLVWCLFSLTRKTVLRVSRLRRRTFTTDSEDRHESQSASLTRKTVFRVSEIQFLTDSHDRHASQSAPLTRKTVFRVSEK